MHLGGFARGRFSNGERYQGEGQNGKRDRGDAPRFVGSGLRAAARRGGQSCAGVVPFDPQFPTLD